METCQTHGDYEPEIKGRGTKHEIVMNCPGCQDDKIKRREASEGRRSRNSIANMIDKRVNKSGIPPKFRSSLLKDFSDEDRFDEIKNIAINFVNGDGWRALLILGPIGTGKTRLACAILKKALRHSTGLYVTALGMSDKIIRARNPSEFVDDEFLVIDEAGRQYDTAAEKNRIFSVLDGRYSNLRPVVLVANMTQEDLYTRLGEALSDRIRESYEVIVLEGESKR